jgi:hypothetical protein
MHKGRDREVAPVESVANATAYFLVVSAFVVSLLAVVSKVMPESIGAAAGAGAIAGAAAVSVVSVFSDDQAATASTAATRARRFM